MPSSSPFVFERNVVDQQVALHANRKFSLMQNGNIFFAALEGSSNGITISEVTETDTKLVYCNPAFERMTGYEIAEISGKDIHFLSGPGTDPAVRQMLNDAIIARRPFSHEILNYRRDGSSFWSLTSFSPIRDRDGVVRHWLGSYIDVTERHRAEIINQDERDIQKWKNTLIDAIESIPDAFPVSFR